MNINKLCCHNESPEQSKSETNSDMKITSRLILGKIDGLLTQEGLAYHKDLIGNLVESTKLSVAECEAALTCAVENGYIICMDSDKIDGQRYYPTCVGQLLLILIDDHEFDDPTFPDRVICGEVTQNLSQSDLFCAATIGLQMLIKWNCKRNGCEI